MQAAVAAWYSSEFPFESDEIAFCDEEPQEQLHNPATLVGSADPLPWVQLIETVEAAGHELGSVIEEAGATNKVGSSGPPLFVFKPKTVL